MKKRQKRNNIKILIGNRFKARHYCLLKIVFTIPLIVMNEVLKTSFKPICHPIDLIKKRKIFFTHWNKAHQYFQKVNMADQRFVQWALNQISLWNTFPQKVKEPAQIYIAQKPYQLILINFHKINPMLNY